MVFAMANSEHLYIQIQTTSAFVGKLEVYFGKVRLRNSLTNCGLPVFTGRLGSLAAAAPPSVCLFPPRRLRTKRERGITTINKGRIIQEYTNKEIQN